MFEKYDQAIKYMEGLSNLPTENDFMVNRDYPEVYLKRMNYFLKLLGNPERGFKYIHITGTAGKGTVSTMVHGMLYASGKTTGLFTSPFVTTTIEKIKVGNLFISPNEFASIVEKLKPKIDQAYLHGPYGQPSYFEICFAIALLYFKQKKCDYVVLEVGLGGRYDATNVIPSPIITAITNIDYDHTEILGKTLKEIALDKGGIIKKGSIFITSEHRSAILKQFNDICIDKRVEMIVIPKKNNHQERNKCLAKEIGRFLNLKERAIEKAISETKLPARFESIQNRPLIILDGAHNRTKIASTVKNLKGLKYKKLNLLIALAENKDSLAILKQIVPLAHNLYLTRFQITNRKCAHPKRLLKIAKPYLNKNCKVNIFLDPHQALLRARKETKKGDCLLVTGSFFLAGELRENWIKEEEVLKSRKSF